MGTEKEHIVMLPFMAQGHLRPFLQLAHRLQPYFTITLLTTPLNAISLRQSTTTTTTTNIHIVDLPFNSADHGLPPGVENTDKVPLPLVIKLFHSSTSLEPHVRRFLSLHSSTYHRPPLCVIFDVFLGWAADVARTFDSVGISFTTCGAYGAAAYISIWNHLPHRNLSDDQDFLLPGFPPNLSFHRSQLHRFLRFADGTDDWSKYFQPQIRVSMKSSGWLCNTVEEMEPLGLKILRNYLNLPVWTIGPLVNSSSSGGYEDHECLKWLNEKQRDSVLYISFGSQNTITPTQMMELATGLEQSGKPFLWVIRPPFGFDINGELKSEWLPEGFEERVIRGEKQGLLVHKWGPQLEILRHEATGAFLSHCGWNSVLEGMSCGLPVIGWPLAAEQAYNSKMLVEEMGVAVELTRGLDGVVKREEVKRVVELVLERDEGSCGLEMKKKAVEVGMQLKDAVRNDEGGGYKGLLKALDDFVDAIVSGRLKNAA